MEKRYEEAVWAWFIPQARIHNGYGWLGGPYAGEYEQKQVQERILHLIDCGVDMEVSELPNLGTVSEFDGTDCDNQEIDAVVAERLACNCKKIDTTHYSSRDTYGIPGEFTLGMVLTEVLAEAAKLDEKDV